MEEKQTLEIPKTEYVYRDLPSITYELNITASMTEAERIYISVSDKTSSGALKTFREVQKDVEKRKNDKLP